MKESLEKANEIVKYVIQSADEMIEGKSALNPVEYGQLIGYAEVLSIIRSICTDEEVEELGIDFDYDDKYLSIMVKD